MYEKKNQHVYPLGIARWEWYYDNKKRWVSFSNKDIEGLESGYQKAQGREKSGMSSISLKPSSVKFTYIKSEDNR